MNKNFKKISITLVTIIIISVVGIFATRYYAYHAGVRDLQSEQAAFTVKTIDILAEFKSNEAAANKKYLEKPVVILGVITSINGKEIIIDEVVVCSFSIANASLNVGQTISVKGRVIGYDDLMGGVNMDQCSINK